MKILKVFGADIWHSPVHIVANRDSLIQMKEMIEEALRAEYSSSEFDQGDGEIYDLEITMIDSDNLADWYDLPEHYIDDITHPAQQEENTKKMYQLINNKKNKGDHNGISI